MGNVSPTPHQLMTEGVIFWSIGLVLYVGRVASRTIANGSIKRLSLDDYVMSVTFVIYTALLVLIQISARYATNLMDPADYDRVLSDPQEVKDRILGSKIVIGLEQCMLFSTWGAKICMLTMFWRLTKNLRLHLYVKIVAFYVALGFVVIMITYYAVYCRPFSQYWAMPVQNMQCATYQRYSITQAVFNISSDAAMLVVPIPLLIKAQMKTAKKILLVCIMSLGVFTIVAAILNKVYNFASPFTTTYQIWYIREASTAIYVANLVCLWPLLRKVFGIAATKTGSTPIHQQGIRPSKDSSGASRSADIPAVSAPSRPSLFLDQVKRFKGFGCRKSIQGVVGLPPPRDDHDDPRGSKEVINKLEYRDLAQEVDEIELKAQNSHGIEPDLEAGEMSGTRSHHERRSRMYWEEP